MENEATLKRTEEIQDIWEQRFLSPQDYVEKRSQFQKEMDALRPVDYDSLMEAADLIANFKTYWEACEAVDDPKAARQQLVAKIVDRVFVYDKAVVAIALHGDFGVVLNAMEEAPIQIANAIGVVISGFQEERAIR